jgi:DNA transformation protein and related proteins
LAVSAEYREYVLEQLGRLSPVTSRAMFGGVGVYSDGLFFALMDDDLLYFKTDERTRGDYERVGMGPFRPFGPDSKPMGYHQVPAELLETPDLLRPWVEQALSVARAARRKRPSGS